MEIPHKIHDVKCLATSLFDPASSGKLGAKQCSAETHDRCGKRPHMCVLHRGRRAWYTASCILLRVDLLSALCHCL